jgi:hypothetical protein
MQHIIATTGGEPVHAFPVDVFGLRYATEAVGKGVKGRGRSEGLKLAHQSSKVDEFCLIVSWWLMHFAPVRVRFSFLCGHFFDELRFCTGEYDLLERVGQEGQGGAVRTLEPAGYRGIGAS